MIREGIPAVSPALTAILELARWAPSGDNTQPWRFEVQDDRHVVLHGHDTRRHCVYDLDGQPSLLAIGCLIETMAIAASAEGWRLESATPHRLAGRPADLRPLLSSGTVGSEGRAGRRQSGRAVCSAGRWPCAG